MLRKLIPAMIALAIILTACTNPAPATPKAYLSNEILSAEIREYAAAHEIQSGHSYVEDLEVTGLGGHNTLRTNDQCFRESDISPEGDATIICQRTINIWLDDPSTADSLEGTIIVSINGDGSLEAEKGRGWFERGEPLDATQMVQQYHLENVVAQAQTQVKLLRFTINFYTGVTP